MAGTPLPSAADRAVVDVYRAVFATPFESFRETILRRLADVIPFSSAVWGSGLRASNEMLSVSMCDLAPETLLAYAAHWEAQDFVRAAAVASPGRAFRNEDVMPLPRYHQTEIYRRFSQPAGIEHALGVVEPDPVTDLADMVFLFRADPAQPYTDAERGLLEHLAPHLVNAWRQAQLAHHYRAAANGSGAGLNAHESYAVTDGGGLVHAAGEDFCMMLRTVAPDWRGPTLPEALAPLQRGEAGLVVLGDYEFRVRRLNDRYLFSATAGGGVLGLSPAETRVARLYASGLTQQDVARRVGVSVHTIRNQLVSVYAKLGVHSKVELVRALNHPRD